MKKVIFYSILLISFSTLTASATTEADFQSCRGIKDNLQRLDCFDRLVPLETAAQTNDTGTVSMSVIDYMTDYKVLKGKAVSVAGFAIIMGEMGFLYPERGQLSGIMVEINKLGREDRRSLLTNCGTGCDITITGKAADQFGNAAISATSVSFD
jgi:hypothetical protein